MLTVAWHVQNLVNLAVRFKTQPSKYYSWADSVSALQVASSKHLTHNVAASFTVALVLQGFPARLFAARAIHDTMQFNDGEQCQCRICYFNSLLYADEGHLGVIVALLEVARPGDEAGQKEKHSFSAFLNRSNSYGQTALMLACKNG